MFRKTFSLLILAALLAAAAGCACGEEAWQAAYRDFILSGRYSRQIHAADPVFTEALAERDPAWDRFAVWDIDEDGVPELLVETIYAMEQVDVFAFEDGDAAWKGTMGGDNFFQAVVSYAKAGKPGVLYALMGGPAMEIDEYRLVPAGLLKVVRGMTRVDDEGMELAAADLYEADDTLEQLIVGTLMGSGDRGEYPVWYSSGELESAPGWPALPGA